MKMSQVLAASHPILDSVTPESFAKDCGLCLVTGTRLVKDSTTESGFGEQEKLMPVLSLVPRGVNKLKQLKAELLKQKKENIAAYAKQFEELKTAANTLDGRALDAFAEQCGVTLEPVHSHEMPLGKNLLAFASKFGIDTEFDVDDE